MFGGSRLKFPSKRVKRLLLFCDSSTFRLPVLCGRRGTEKYNHLEGMLSVRLSTRPLLNQRLALKPHEKGRDSTGYLWCGAGLSCAASTRLNNLCCCFALSQKEVMENVLRAEGYPTIPHHHPIIYSSIIHPSIPTSFFCFVTIL